MLPLTSAPLKLFENKIDRFLHPIHKIVRQISDPAIANIANRESKIFSTTWDFVPISAVSRERLC